MTVKRYHIRDHAETNPPDYERVARLLSDAELEEEILARLGTANYQLVLLAESDRRGKQPPPEPGGLGRNFDADDKGQ